MFNKHPRHSGLYRIKDNINKLELEVHLQHVNTLLKLPTFIRNPSTTSRQQEDTAIFARIKWQQKILSPHEAELYKDSANCATDTQKQYHKWLKEREDDMASGRSKLRSRRKTSKKLQKQSDSNITLGQELFTYTANDAHRPADEQLGGRKVDASALEEQESMYVYATLEPDTLLVSLHWHPDTQILQIYPDFNSLEDSPYFIEIDTDYRHLYAFAVVNVSPKRPWKEEARQIVDYLQLPEMLKPLALTPQSPRAESAFAMPPTRTTRVSLLLELRAAQSFELSSSDQLHVRYHIYMPEAIVLEEGLLHASTQSASPPSNAAQPIHFGYTWQVTVLCEEHFQPAHQMHIFFEVISEDSWGRERLEGYAHYSTFLIKPGSEVVTLNCLRPVDDFMEKLRRFFIGGRKKYDFMNFFAGPSLGGSPKGSMQCRYGERWQNTGKLEFHCQRITQKNGELWRPCATGPSYGMALDDIMMAYQEARRRLEAIVF